VRGLWGSARGFVQADVTQVLTEVADGVKDDASAGLGELLFGEPAGEHPDARDLSPSCRLAVPNAVGPIITAAPPPAFSIEACTMSGSGLLAFASAEVVSSFLSGVIAAREGAMGRGCCAPPSAQQHPV
jgi:hypothetical protein